MMKKIASTLSFLSLMGFALILSSCGDFDRLTMPEDLDPDGNITPDGGISEDPSVTQFDEDYDNDGVEDEIDNCVVVANADQADSDQDDLGNACDTDDDSDRVFDKDDNCPLISNPGQEDADADNVGDACE